MSDAIEQRLKKFVQGLQQEHYELLHKYGYADFKLEENPVDGYEAEALWLSGVYKTELLQLLNEAVRSNNELWFQYLINEIGYEKARQYRDTLTPKENNQ